MELAYEEKVEKPHFFSENVNENNSPASQDKKDFNKFPTAGEEDVSLAVMGLLRWNDSISDKYLFKCLKSGPSL